MERILADPGFVRARRRNPESIGLYSWAAQLTRLRNLLPSPPPAGDRAAQDFRRG
jgi:hypothetical protein